MINVYVLSRQMAEAIYVFGNNTLVISIGSPVSVEFSKAKIKGDHVHFFQFHDIDRDIKNDNGDVWYEAMKPEMAEAIVEVAFNNRDKRCWVIHCEAGISRSPGIALGLSSFIALNPNGEELARQFPCYNKHVRRLIEEACVRKIAEINENLRKG